MFKENMSYLLKIGIIGGNGYLGSVLCRNLNNCFITKLDYNVNTEIISTFNIIIYMGGKSSRNITEKEAEENINHIISIAKMIKSSQLLIYASTSAIYEGYFNAKEDFIPKYELLDSYSKSMWKREQEIKLLSIRSVGVRLGIVIGFSPKQRTDLLHIKMVKCALTEKKIYVTNSNSWRPILSMDEMVRAFQTLIDNQKKITSHHTYNVASFNITVGDVALSIAKSTGAEIIYGKNSLNENGFSIDSTKFKTEFRFLFTSTNDSIINSLLENKTICIN